MITPMEIPRVPSIQDTGSPGIPNKGFPCIYNWSAAISLNSRPFLVPGLCKGGVNCKYIETPSLFFRVDLRVVLSVRYGFSMQTFSLGS